MLDDELGDVMLVLGLTLGDVDRLLVGLLTTLHEDRISRVTGRALRRRKYVSIHLQK